MPIITQEQFNEIKGALKKCNRSVVTWFNGEDTLSL